MQPQAQQRVQSVITNMNRQTKWSNIYIDPLDFSPQKPSMFIVQSTPAIAPTVGVKRSRDVQNVNIYAPMTSGPGTGRRERTPRDRSVSIDTRGHSRDVSVSSDNRYRARRSRYSYFISLNYQTSII